MNKYEKDIWLPKETSQQNKRFMKAQKSSYLFGTSCSKKHKRMSTNERLSAKVDVEHVHFS